MTKEVNGIIILDNGVSVLPTFNNCCPKCKKNLSSGSDCYQCRDFSYELAINLGYYYSRWYKMDDKYIRSGVDWPPELNDVNPNYRFSKLINDAKQRWKFNTIPERKQIINILSNGFAWNIEKNYSRTLMNDLVLIDYFLQKSLK